MKQGTGALWRIRRLPNVPQGDRPPAARRVPFYPIQAAVVGGLLAAGAAVVIGLVRRLARRR